MRERESINKENLTAFTRISDNGSLQDVFTARMVQIGRR